MGMTSVILVTFSLIADGSESEHYPAEFWMGSDHKYHIRIYDGQKLFVNGEHEFTIPYIIHDGECPCEWWKKPYSD